MYKASKDLSKGSHLETTSKVGWSGPQAVCHDPCFLVFLDTPSFPWKTS